MFPDFSKTASSECPAMTIPSTTSSQSTANKCARSIILPSTPCLGKENPFNASSPATSSKCSLSFILSCSPQTPSAPSPAGHDKRRASWSSASEPRFGPNTVLALSQTKACTIDTSNASSSNIGALNIKKGTRFCVVAGCTSLAKHNRRCWRHGGSIKCKVADCDNRAKSKGVCWSHGGGTRCRVDKCDTISISKGFCWAHGGGKRCLEPDCAKPGFERTQNYCATHFKAMKRVRVSRTE